MPSVCECDMRFQACKYRRRLDLKRCSDARLDDCFFKLILKLKRTSVDVALETFHISWDAWLVHPQSTAS